MIVTYFKLCKVVLSNPVGRPLVGSLLLRIPRRQERRFVTDRVSARDHGAPRRDRPQEFESLRPSSAPGLSSLRPFSYFRHCGLYFAPIKWNPEWMAHARAALSSHPPSRSFSVRPPNGKMSSAHRRRAAAPYPVVILHPETEL